MKMIWQLQNYALMLASLTSLLYTQMNARGIPSILVSCNKTCDVSCINKNKCRANCDNNYVDYVPNECNAVEELTIDDNAIHEIDDTTFENFTKLTVLSMAHNGINVIADDSFNRTKLTDVELSHNHITTLQGSVFRALTNLTRLKLSHNSLRSVDLQGLSRLQHLSLSHNSIAMLTRENFTRTNLTFLDLSHNKLTELVNDCLGELTNLEILLLSGNSIQTVENNAFFHLESLRILKLDSNQLAGEFNGNSFAEQSSKKLEELDISNNQLTYLNKNMFHRLNLQRLTVQHNLISDISRNTFWFQTKIVEINLEGNRIGTKSQDAFLMLLEEKTDIIVKLAGNNICETYVAEFKDYYGTSIFCLPNQTAEYLGKVSPTPGMPNTPDSVTGTEGSKTLLVVCAVSGSILGVLIILLMLVRVKNKLRRGNIVLTNRGYNLPHQQRLEHHQIPMHDAPPPPVPARNPTMSSGPYMNETLGSNSTQSYIQPSPATPSRGTCTHQNRSCHRHHRHPVPPIPDKYKSSPNLRNKSETGSIVIVGTTHGGTGKAHMTGLPKLKKQWRRSLTRHLPGHSGHYLARRETKDGRPVTPEDKEETSYLTRHETIDGRPKFNTMGTATYKSVHN